MNMDKSFNGGLSMTDYISSQTVLKELGKRLKTYRIQNTLTQDDLANKSGVSRRSIQYMEDGQEVKFSTVIKILIALDLGQNLDLLIPNPSRSPINIMRENAHKKRSRVSRLPSEPTNKNFKWGDES